MELLPKSAQTDRASHSRQPSATAHRCTRQQSTACIMLSRSLYAAAADARLTPDEFPRIELSSERTFCNRGKPIRWYCGHFPRPAQKDAAAGSTCRTVGGRPRSHPAGSPPLRTRQGSHSNASMCSPAAPAPAHGCRRRLQSLPTPPLPWHGAPGKCTCQSTPVCGQPPAAVVLPACLQNQR